MMLEKDAVLVILRGKEMKERKLTEVLLQYNKGRKLTSLSAALETPEEFMMSQVFGLEMTQEQIDKANKARQEADDSS